MFRIGGNYLSTSWDTIWCELLQWNSKLNHTELQYICTSSKCKCHDYTNNLQHHTAVFDSVILISYKVNIPMLTHTILKHSGDSYVLNFHDLLVAWSDSSCLITLILLYQSNRLFFSTLRGTIFAILFLFCIFFVTWRNIL